MNDKVFVALIAAVAAIIGGLITSGVAYVTGNREMDVKMVEIAVGILGQEPKENIAPARDWAVDLINEFAGVNISPEARAALVNNRAITLDALANPFFQKMLDSGYIPQSSWGQPPAKP